MISLIAIWGGAVVFLTLVMGTAWIVQMRTGQGGWADVFWSYGLGVAGVGISLFPVGSDGWSARQLVVALLIGIWGIRLGTHIARRAAGEQEDARYARLRDEWGNAYRAKMFGFMMLQAGAASILALAVLLAARNPSTGLGLLDYLAIAVFLVAFAGETMADQQLKAFKAATTKRHQICDVGLWGWSRHPNYFFEWLTWCAWPLFAINLSGHWPWGWLAFIAPLYMYWILNHVSGVPLVEAHMQRTRPEAFANYARRTSRFFLRPPAR